MASRRKDLCDEEKMILEMLRTTPRGMTITVIVEGLETTERKDALLMINHLKALGLIRRKETTATGHQAVWVLM